MLDNEKLKMITNVRERITAFFDTDDNRLDSDYIWEQCLLLRPLFIERSIERLGARIEEFLSRIEITVQDYHVTSNPTFPGHKRAAIPKLMEHKDNIKYVGPVNMALNQEYTRVSYDGFFRLSGRTWTSAKIFYLVFQDKIFFSSPPVDDDGVAYSILAMWCLLNNVSDDPSYDEATTSIVPKKYQTMLEEMVADSILKYADQGKLNRTNNATDQDAE
jgi:hypothetical protein